MVGWMSFTTTNFITCIFHEDGEIHGDITVYEVTDNTIKELKKGIN